MTDSSDPIIIVGAGIGGLFAALCLHHHGLNSIVLEKAEDLVEVGAGIQIGANGSRLIHKLGIQSEFEKSAAAPAKGLMMDGNSGRPICHYPLSGFAEKYHQFPHYQIRRADLQQVLATALESRMPGCVRLATELSDIRQTPETLEAIATDGQVFCGRAVVGCDGIHSRTRQLVFGDTEPNFAGCVAWRALIPISEMELPNPELPRIWVGKGRHLVQYPVGSGSLVNIVACVDSAVEEQERWSGRSSTAELVESFSDWCPEINKLLSKTEDALRWGLYERSVLDSWNAGRITLLGDAAHAMLPSLAQGAVMAMEDADQLAESLAAQENTEVALLEYQSRRIFRTRKTQLVARKNMEFFHQRGLANKLSVKALRLAGSRAETLIGNRYNWLYGYTTEN
jgi:salicylate hydroxylase